MSNSVPILSMVFMALSALICFGVPVALLVLIRKKTGAKIWPFFIGCAVMLLFALILESAVHQIVLNSALGAQIRGTLWLYALYGGAMAALFEETGRLLAFRTVLKKTWDNDGTALMVGAGHGGFEAAALVGLTMVSNLSISLMINSGSAELLTSAVTGEALDQVNEALRALIETPSYQFLLSIVERLSAVALHVALSVLVWFAVTKRKGGLYLAALGLHFAMDAATVILSGLGAPLLLTEAVIAAVAVVSVLLARLVWKREHMPPIEESPQIETE